MMGLLGDSFPLDPQTMAWVAKVVSTGGTVSQARKIVANTLITSLRSNSLLSILDRCWVLGFADENAVQAKVDLINLAVLTQVGGTLGSGGWTGNGTSEYLDTGYNPGGAGTFNFVQNSATYGAYCRTTNTVLSLWYGAGDATNLCQFTVPTLGTSPADRPQNWMNIISANIPAVGNTNIANSLGRWVATRTGSGGDADQALYLNGGASVLAALGSSSSNGVPNAAFYLGGKNDNGTPSYATPSLQLAYWFAGAGVNQTQNTNLDTALSACMTSLGI